MKPTERPTKFLWLDLEMTGLNSQKNRIVEVAAIVTDHNLKELATYHSLIAHDETSLKAQLEADPFWSAHPAAAKKIIQDSRQGNSEAQVEQELITLVKKYFMPGEAVYLAGNSIRVDRLFIDQWLPKFAILLHYRMLDVTAFKLWWVSQGGQEFVKKENHRALEDIRESIAELQFYTSKFIVK